MRSKWQTTSLADCAENGEISYGIVQPGNHVEDGMPIILVNNFENGGLNVADLRRVSSDIAGKYKRTRLQGGEVLITLVGSVGQVAIVPPQMKGWNVARAVAVIRPNGTVDPDWIKYFLMSSEAQEFLGARANTTVQTTINLKDLRSLEVPCPPDSYRESALGTILSIDDKITNNRALAADLEAMARAIFKSWFVDFDPVKAKMQGRPPAGMDADTAALFPDELVESELGLIPKGWEVVPLSGVAEFLNGLALQKFPPSGQGDDLPVLKIAQLRARQLDFEKLASRDVSSRYLVSAGDLIFSWSGSLIVDFWAGPDCALNQHLFKVTPKPWATPGLLWAGIYHHIDQFREIAAGKAVTMGHINRKHLDEAKLALPAKASVKKFCRQLDSLTAYACQLEAESQELATLRDTLLPRLISGKLRLPDAEAAIAEATA